MRKFLAIIITVFCLFSCGDDVEFNNPTFQGIKDGNLFWKASSHTIDVDINGFLTIVGSNEIGTLTLRMPSVSTGNYVLGNVPSMSATFQEATNTFSTNNIGARGPFDFSDGEIVIENVDFTNNTFTGTFRFNAFDRTGLASVNFIEGVFYKLSLTAGAIPTTIVTCDDVQLATLAALVNFQNTNPSNPSEYFPACEAYKTALENQKVYCGDAGGALQDIIDALGDCVL